jgi:hypothetical protein
MTDKDVALSFVIEEYKALQAEILQRNTQAYVAVGGWAASVGALVSVTYSHAHGGLLQWPWLACAAAFLVVSGFFTFVLGAIVGDTKLASRRLVDIEKWVNKKTVGKEGAFFPLCWQREFGIDKRILFQAWRRWASAGYLEGVAAELSTPTDQSDAQTPPA